MYIGNSQLKINCYGKETCHRPVASAAQMKEFWGQVSKGLITKKSFQEFLEQKKTCPLPTETSHLRLIGETTISATKAGPGMKQENQNLFYGVDPDFDKWDAQTVSKDTEEATAYVYEQIQTGTYAEIFGSFNKDLDLLSFETHEQIKDFVENSSELLHTKGKSTLFLFKKKKDKHFVADVYYISDSDLIVVGLDEFSRRKVWSGIRASRFVVLAKTLEIKD